MDDTKAKEILDRVVGAIFGYQNPLTLDQARQKFAFDLRLPQQVYDSFTQAPAWASSINPTKFVAQENPQRDQDWMRPKKQLGNIEDIIAAWSDTNYTTANRNLDCINIDKCDNVYTSDGLYMCADIRNSKNSIFCEGGDSYEYVVAGSRSFASSFCIRVEDSQLCANSFNVIWSNKVTNSYFIQDCYDIMDCMFCSHLAGKQYCIANMQYTEQEYKQYKQLVTQWILAS